MAYGFRTLNDDLLTQIDEEFRNLVVIASGTGSASAAFGYNDSGAFASQSTCVPLVFVKPASGVQVGNFGVHQGYSAGAWTVGPPYSHFTYESTGSFDWKVCGLDSIPAASGTHGLQVFNGSGAVVYDSRLEYMQIKSMHRYSADNVSAKKSVTIPDQGQTPWFLLNYLILNQVYGEEGPFRAFSGKIVSNTEIELRCFKDTIGASGTDWDGNPLFDVYMPPLILMSAKF